MQRRAFLKTLIGGLAAGAAVRSFPFRVYSFPTEIAADSDLSFPLYSSGGGLPIGFTNCNGPNLILLHPEQLKVFEELGLAAAIKIGARPVRIPMQIHRGTYADIRRH